MYKALSWSTFFQFHNIGYSKATYDFIFFVAQSVIHRNLQNSFIILFLVLTICFSLDLRLTIVNPLYPSSKRMKLYIFICFLSIIIQNIYHFTFAKNSIFDIFEKGTSFDFKAYVYDNTFLFNEVLIIPLLL